MGGAIFNMGASTVPGSGTLTIINSTLTGNTAQGGNGFQGGSGFGGAIFNLDGSVTLQDATIASNTVAAGTSNTGPAGTTDGGAVYSLAFGHNINNGTSVLASLTLDNSILANTTGGTDLVSQATASGVTGIHGSTSLVMSNTLIASTVDAGVITVVTDPVLGALANNGGPTKTMALLTGSPALNAGSNAAVPPGVTTDQRGPGFARISGAAVDLGAFEVQVVVPVPPTPVAPPPFVSVAFGPSGEVIEVVGSDGTLTQVDPSGTHVLGGGVRAASVAFGPAGEEELLVTFLDGRLIQFNASGATQLGIGVSNASLAFGPFGEVIEVVRPDGTLTQYDAFGAHLLGGGVSSASVAFGPAGEVIEVVRPDGTLTQFDAAGAHLLGGGVSSAGVAFDAAGSVVLDVLFRDGRLVQFGTPTSGTLPTGLS
jgi:hypothetical protein